MADVSLLSRVREVSKPVPAVAQNIATSRQPVGRFKTIDRAAMIQQAAQPTTQQAAQPFTRLGVSIDLDRPAHRGPSTADWQQPSSRHGIDHVRAAL